MINYKPSKEKLEILEEVWFVSKNDIESLIDYALDYYDDDIDVECEFILTNEKNTLSYKLSNNSIELIESFSFAGLIPNIKFKFTIQNNIHNSHFKKIEEIFRETLSYLNTYYISENYSGRKSSNNFTYSLNENQFEINLRLTDTLQKKHRFKISYFDKFLTRLEKLQFETSVYKTFLVNGCHYENYQQNKSNILHYVLYFELNKVTVEFDLIDKLNKSKEILLEIITELGKDFNSITYDFGLKSKNFGQLDEVNIKFSISLKE